MVNHLTVREVFARRSGVFAKAVACASDGDDVAVVEQTVVARGRSQCITEYGYSRKVWSTMSARPTWRR